MLLAMYLKLGISIKQAFIEVLFVFHWAINCLTERPALRNIYTSIKQEIKYSHGTTILLTNFKPGVVVAVVMKSLFTILNDLIGFIEL